MKYSKAFQAKMVQKLASPGGFTANALAVETGVSQSTLSRWLREARNVGTMSKPKTKRSKTKKKPWTFLEKMRVVIEASELADEDLGGFLRREGIHEVELEAWRKAAQDALGVTGKRAKNKKSSAESKRIKVLERDLRRKEKALAEAAALLILQKKVNEIWGDEDDDTDERTGK